MGRDKNCLRVALVGGYTTDIAHIRGGVQAATAHLVKGLARINGLELHVMTNRQPGWVGPDSFHENGVCVHLLPPYPRLERLRRYRTHQLIVNSALAQIQPMVIHAQEAAADAYVALRSGFPTVVTAHGIRSEDAKYCRSWSQRLRFYLDAALTERTVMRRVKYLIAISYYVTGYFAPLLRSDAKLYYLPNAVDDHFFDLGSGGRIPGPVESSNHLTVLFAGRVTMLKRVLDLVQAFVQVSRQLPMAELHIAGECATESSYVSVVRNYIQQAGLGEQIHLLGELGQKDLLREYRACTLVTLPSAQENAPMVLAQAMAAGKPVVATRVGGVPEMVGQNNERGLLIDVGDVNALASAIIHLLQSPQRCELLGQAGRVFALENYHLDRVALRTFEAYREIAAAEHRSYG